MLAAILTEAGYRTGLYTSPHLVDFRERMRIDGREIPAGRVVEWSRRLLPEIWRRRATFFEAVTTMAFGWFADEEVDVAVVETGLGGRLDATNVLSPVLSIITTIGLEHTSILGPTVDRIAFEKAGIIKPGTPCVVGVPDGPARSVIERRARELGSPVIDASSCPIRLGPRSIEGTEVSMPGASGQWTRIRVGLPGLFQSGNIQTALAAVEALRQVRMPIPQAAVVRGLRDVVSLTGVRGRLSLVRKNPRIILDVGHNPAAMRMLAASLRDLKVRPTATVIGVAADKDLRSIARAIGMVAGDVIAVAARTSRARPASDVSAAFEAVGRNSVVAPSVAEGLRQAIRRSGRHGTLLVTGSHFVAGEALAYLERRRYLTISQ
jgi:dihydrofolate synthase/folylpolyglutamate synthase